MSEQAHEMTPLELQQQRRGRILGAAIMLVVLLPMLVAYGVFYTGIGMPTSTVNKGELLAPPQAASDLDLRQLDSTPWQITDQKKRWRWLIPGNSECAQACQQNLYLTRQVHIRLAEKSTRVERIYLLLDNDLSSETAAFLAAEHPHMPILKVDPVKLQAAIVAGGLPADSLAGSRYFLMDQEGFVMMSYTPTHTGQQLLDDIKRMLKYSYED
jgi:hypothetical protein